MENLRSSEIRIFSLHQRQKVYEKRDRLPIDENFKINKIEIKIKRIFNNKIHFPLPL